MKKVAVSYALLGRTIEIATNDPWCNELLEAGFDLLRAPAKTPCDHHATLMRESCGLLHLRYDSHELPYPEPYEQEPFRAASSAVDALFARFAQHTSDHIVLRGASIASRDGAVLLVGPQGIGTSLLALHLAHLGAQLLGDDMALIAPAARTVIAVPRRPRLREGALRFIPTREMRESVNVARHVYRSLRGRQWYALCADDIGGIRPSANVNRLRAVVVIEQRNTEQAQVRQLTADDALSAILNHGQTGWQRLSHISALRGLLEAIPCISLALSAPGESARLLTRALIARL